jgi:hypothetical protein
MKDKETAVQWLLCEPLEWIVDKTDGSQIIRFPKGSIEQAKEIEQIDIDNKVIHFAEWLTKKHTTELITLYKQFKENEYNN